LAGIKVRKKGGYAEDFDTGKVKASLLKAGCTESEAENIGEKIEAWAEKQPGKIVHSFEIEKQVIEQMKVKHKDVLITFLIYARNKIKPFKRIFNRKDIAQMLTSLFIIIQVYVIETVEIPLSQAIPVLITSSITCGVILWFIEGRQLWKHLISGFIVVSLLSLIVGIILGITLPEFIIAISAGLPVAAMVDVLKD